VAVIPGQTRSSPELAKRMHESVPSRPAAGEQPNRGIGFGTATVILDDLDLAAELCFRSSLKDELSLAQQDCNIIHRICRC
jgi:hypothetical protein